MKSTDFNAMVLEGEVVCKKHLAYKEWKLAQPIFADSEWDRYPICNICNEIHDYVNLTEEGRKYERYEKIEE